jgi:hypothetical protein
MQGVDHIYNAMHSGEVTAGGMSMQNHHKPAVHGPERPPNINDTGSLLVHSLYVGSRDGKAYSDADRPAI